MSELEDLRAENRNLKVLLGRVAVELGRAMKELAYWEFKAQQIEQEHDARRAEEEKLRNNAGWKN